MTQADPGCTRLPRASSYKSASGERTAISRDHFAFLRGWLQGVETRQLWHQYLQRLGPWDERRGRVFLRDLLHELGAVSRRSGRPGYAGLLRRHKSHITGAAAAGAAPIALDLPPANVVPNLEEFAAQFDQDMYSEAELIELWKEAHPTSAPGKRVRRDVMTRRARLIERQLEALDWLERLSCERPQLRHPTLAWLESKVCARLATADIQTLGELHQFVGRHGTNWYKKVERIGIKGAEVIVSWLRNQQDSLGALPSTALMPAGRAQVALASAAPVGVAGLVPLERLALPSSLASADPRAPGSNRAPPLQCKIAAADDYGAVQVWLAQRDPKSHTWRAYRREAERFLLWSVFEAGKPLSALTSLDCAAYRDFLGQPGSRWMGRRNTQRWSPLWRPFEGPLSAASIRTACVILQSMCEWLARGRHLVTNPWAGVAEVNATASTPSPRVLTKDQWHRVEAWLTTLPHDARSARIRLLLGLGYRTGMRLAELAAARVDWLRHEQLEGGSWAWSIMVPGGDNQRRKFALHSSAVEVLANSFARRGLKTGLLDNPAETPLIAALPSSAGERDGGRSLTPGRIYEIVRDSFARCAAWVEPLDAKAAQRIRQASTRWLRRTEGSRAAQVAPVEVRKPQTGTRSEYASSGRAERQNVVERVFG